ncbi:MAG TPA: carboxymuconolactone decarboxylase family protein [Burkholderiales bacterium]|nr:carboxymuconolactone decarboxylase family protein [Burkholderiales bacterium]
MTRLAIHDVETAPAEARERVQTVRRANGYLPNLIGVLANAPTALETYQVVGAINARTGLSAQEREVIQITAAARNGCGFCVAGHTAIARKKLEMPEPLIQALRDTRALDDPKLNALARFTLAVMENKGQVSDAELRAFFAAGYTQANALEVVLGVSLATLCNYANNLAGAPINPELLPYA